MTTPWKETTLPTILFKYKLDEIYHADEFVFFVSFFFRSNLKIFDLMPA